MTQHSRDGQAGRSRLVIADDHPLFRAALKQMLREQPDLVVVGEAADGREAVKLCRRLRPELILMDLRMPEMDGFEATCEIKRESPSTIVLVITAFEEPDYLLEAIKEGASGYVLKRMDPQQIVGAIRRALDGECPLNQEIAMQLLRRLIEEKHHKKQTAPKPSLSIPLSPREVEVLELLVRGQSNQEIASDLSISMSTVKNHVHQHLYGRHRPVSKERSNSREGGANAPPSRPSRTRWKYLNRTDVPKRNRTVQMIRAGVLEGSFGLSCDASAPVLGLLVRTSTSAAIRGSLVLVLQAIS